mgnify:CR=1 FL=1
MAGSTYYHGGFPGLVAGDRLLPPDATGATTRLSRLAAALGAPHGTRTDVVYLATVQEHARAFAALYPDGALYEAEPVGDVEPDPDAPEAAVMVPAAIITAVIRPRVHFGHRRPESWLRLLVETQHYG